MLHNLTSADIGIYLIIIVALIFCFISFKFYNKYQLILWELQNLQNSANQQFLANQNLNQENIRLLRLNEQQLTKIDFLNQTIEQSEKTKKDYFDLTKASLFEMGSELSKQLITIHKQENNETRTLAEKHITENSTKFNSEFERLINIIGALSKEVEQSKSSADKIKQALLSPSGAGRLAEITLENILKSSGLRALLDYNMQYSVLSADNSKFRPDAVVYLPNNNIMVIDSKASKFLFENASSQDLAKTMNLHLKSLSSKDYALHISNKMNNTKLENYNIITLMFLPTEQAVEKIADSDSNFINNAWALNIFPVGPIGLMNMLSFAKFQITDKLREENHKLIADEIKKLLLSIGHILDHSHKMGNNIFNLAQNYDKFAASFNRNFLSRAQTMKKLGIDVGGKNFEYLKRHHIMDSKNSLIDAEVDIAKDEAEENEAKLIL